MKSFIGNSNAGKFLIVFGIFVIVFSIFFFIGVDKSKNFIKTDAVVSKIQLYEEAYSDGEDYHDATYEVFVKYDVDGVSYDEWYGIFSGYNVGDKLVISYNPNNPKDIVQPISIIVPVIVFSLGVVFLVGGIVVYFRNKELN